MPPFGASGEHPSIVRQGLGMGKGKLRSTGPLPWLEIFTCGTFQSYTREVSRGVECRESRPVGRVSVRVWNE
jgi:hypothetical protein